MNVLKTLVARLPRGMQTNLRRFHYGRQIKGGRFLIEEPEVAILDELAGPGDWVIDVGANIGHYTCALSRRVGPQGRVLAFEPMAETFELLTANLAASGLRNVSLFNIAASSQVSVGSMTLPKFSDTGMDNLYQARLTSGGEYQVLCLPIDALPLPAPIRLMKVDAEGHDLEVLKGAVQLIQRDRPAIIVEASDTGAVSDWLKALGYAITHAAGSPNIVARHPGARSSARPDAIEATS